MTQYLFALAINILAAAIAFWIMPRICPVKWRSPKRKPEVPCGKVQY